MDCKLQRAVDSLLIFTLLLTVKWWGHKGMGCTGCAQCGRGVCGGMTTNVLILRLKVERDV